jgi:hypothetical protein
VALVLVTLSTPARAGQDVMTKESAAIVKGSFIADIETMRVKFVGLAEASHQTSTPGARWRACARCRRS